MEENLKKIRTAINNEKNAAYRAGFAEARRDALSRIEDRLRTRKVQLDTGIPSVKRKAKNDTIEKFTKRVIAGIKRGWSPGICDRTYS